jgi:response regulator RpfG family c-di-GMP phosphodiesterase
LGLRGTEIPLEARIFAIADVWGALRSNRPYREALKDEGVVQYICEQSGKLFDPQMVEAFMKVAGKNSDSVE